MKYATIATIAVFVIISIFVFPFLCNEYWSTYGSDPEHNTYSFGDMVEDLRDDSPIDDMQLPIMYYIVCPICAIFVFFCALADRSGACIFGSLVGVIQVLYIYYQVYLGTTRWYLGLHAAQLTYGYYISCVGFIAMLIISLCTKRE